jgi:hypothetical protein
LSTSQRISFLTPKKNALCLFCGTPKSSENNFCEDTLAIKGVEILKPKVVIFENVMGLLFKKNKTYVDKIINKLTECGYKVSSQKLFSEDLPAVIVKQTLSFFINLALNKECFLPSILSTTSSRPPSVQILLFHRYLSLDSSFNVPCSDIFGSFPRDYNFYGTSVVYSVGMSVPPLMIARIADDLIKQIYFRESRILKEIKVEDFLVNQCKYPTCILLCRMANHNKSYLHSCSVSCSLIVNNHLVVK